MLLKRIRILLKCLGFVVFGFAALLLSEFFAERIGAPAAVVNVVRYITMTLVMQGLFTKQFRRFSGALSQTVATVREAGGFKRYCLSAASLPRAARK